ncbi:MAG: carboxypeptidase regulatory-like domain-containing protein [Candidatus Sericytochromatia bacterium]|nr:carboxypeptidase regulatory-like domain-containing protein [Candidatus Sericytochromatia bacterium]
MRRPFNFLASLLGIALITAGCGRVSATQTPRLKASTSTVARSQLPVLTAKTTQPPPAGLTLNANRGSTVQGQVVHQLNQQPIAGVTIVAQPSGQRTMTDLAGRFTFGSLPSGNYTFQAMGPDLVQMAPIGALVMAGEATNVPTISMVPGVGPSGITRINYILEKEFGREGEAPAPLLDPMGVVARGSAVQVLDRNDAAWVKTGVVRQYDAEAGRFQGKFGDYSKWLGFTQMRSNVKSITLDRQGRTIVIDGARKLWRFDSSGKKEREIELAADAADITLDAGGHLVTAGSGGLMRLSPEGEGGQTVGALGECRAVAGGKDGLWVISGQKVGKVNPDGQLTMEFGPGGADGNQSFTDAVDLAVDPRNGHVVVADKGTQQVYVYDVLGNLIGNVGQGIFSQPVAVTVDAGGRIYVVDQSKRKVYKFLPGVTR